VADFLTRYASEKTRRANEQILLSAFRHAGKRHPEQLTTTDVVTYATGRTHQGGDPANNTVRNRFMIVREFLRYCRSEGIPVVDLDPTWRKIRKSYPTTYGRAQAKYPGRWLTRDQAFGQLLDACKDGTWPGSRDQLVCRLCLLGIRRHEVSRLTVGAIQDNELRWIGKGRRARSLVIGPTLAALLTRWLRQYESQLARPLRDTDPLICKGRHYAGQLKSMAPGDPRRVMWGEPISDSAVRDVVTKRAQLAGLGHVQPHDLRRTAAGLMHAETTEDGAHRFDVEDIRRVLSHADLATTQRAYLDQLDNSAKLRASFVLD